jgi:hypothetical protein
VGVAVGDGASAFPQATIAKATRRLAARRAPVFKGELLSLPVAPRIGVRPLWSKRCGVPGREPEKEGEPGLVNHVAPVVHDAVPVDVEVHSLPEG